MGVLNSEFTVYVWLLDAFVHFCYYGGVCVAVTLALSWIRTGWKHVLCLTTLSNVTVGTIRDDVLLL